jgi:hypothetical protein
MKIPSTSFLQISVRRKHKAETVDGKRFFALHQVALEIYTSPLSFGSFLCRTIFQGWFRTPPEIV